MVAQLRLKAKNLGLTIVVPVHNISGRASNLAKWVSDAVRGNVRVILVHDRSQDSTSSELEKILEVNSSNLITILEVDFQSPGLTRNFGLDKVTTPWFSFADADDFVNIPNMLKLVLEAENANSTMGVGAFLTRNLQSNRLSSQKIQTMDKANFPLDLALHMGLWRCVFSSSTTHDLHFDKQLMGEDYLFMNKAIDAQQKIHISNLEVYTYYFGGSQNLTSNKNVMIDMFEVIKRICLLEPKTKIAKDLRIFSIQKLSISAIKNVPLAQLVPHLPTLIFYLFSKPTYLLRLLNKYYFARSEAK
jgi:glycosyltransferase involved in cell wall biosynthesis